MQLSNNAKGQCSSIVYTWAICDLQEEEHSMLSPVWGRMLKRIERTILSTRPQFGVVGFRIRSVCVVAWMFPSQVPTP